MGVTRFLGFLLLFLVLSAAWAQPGRMPNIAVIDFVGDRTVTPEQLNFISGILATELINSDQFQVLDRGRMDAILREQGFQQTGACNSNECQVQVGQLLGVDYLVAGNLVRFGPTYMMRVDYLDVSTARITASVNLQEKGELHEVVNRICERATQQLLANLQTQNAAKAQAEQAAAQAAAQSAGAIQLTAPVVTETPKAPVPKVTTPRRPLSTKRKIALALVGGSLAAGGAGYWFDTRLNNYREDYQNALASNLLEPTQKAYDYAVTAERNRNISYGVSLGTAAVAAVLWFLPEGGN